jgi:hypothetical protein
MKTQTELQRLGDAVIVLKNLRRYCSEFTTGTRPSDKSIVEAIDIVLSELHAQAPQDSPTSDR